MDDHFDIGRVFEIGKFDITRLTCNSIIFGKQLHTCKFKFGSIHVFILKLMNFILLIYFYLVFCLCVKIYLRNKETQQTLRVIVNIQYDASF